MSRQVGSDLLGILRGAQMVAGECVKVQESQAKHLWKNSSVRSALSQTSSNPLSWNASKNIPDLFNEGLQRASMVTQGLRALILSGQAGSYEESEGKDYLIYDNMVLKPDDIEKMLVDSYPHSESSNLYEASILASVERTVDPVKPPSRAEPVVPKVPIKVTNPDNISEPFSSIKETLKVTSPPLEQPRSPPLTLSGSNNPEAKKIPVVKTVKFKQKLSEVAKERKVPSSRIERVISFGTLAAGLGVGTVAEMTRRTLGINSSVGDTLDSAFLTPANAERIVNTLCKVRGAALKIGQLLSIQDNTVISPVLQQAFERVRQSADFMPRYQIEAVLESQLGKDWRNKFVEFDMKPFAAASIGQVHQGQLPDGRLVAVKIQYPGVAQGINSDIDNLVSILNLWNIFPDGMFIDKIVEVAKKELSWEVDYEREAECTKKFKNLLAPYEDYYVPSVIDDLCTKQIFTSELIEGDPVDKASEFDEATRKHVCKLIMDLCLKELFKFRCMQTDPNWSNFFYNQETRKLILLDFGSTRSYSRDFMDEYIEVIKAAAENDRKSVLELSRKMKFLTGFESKAMEEAHVDTVMILGEVFQEAVGEFDFGRQDTTVRVTRLVPTILTHRLCPPPEEIYSLHRKLSGVFLLCAKLKVKMACRPLFLDVYNSYPSG